MSTTQNLKDAFAGESQANRTYLAFAKKADKDGLPQVGRLFRAAAAAETIHAHAHLRVLGTVKETTDNLQAAIAGEGHEFKEMYPAFLAEAQKEDNKAAIASFENALAVEEIHHNLYTDALNTVKAGNDLPQTKIFVCCGCGHTVNSAAPDTCPICNAPKKNFFDVE